MSNWKNILLAKNVPIIEPKINPVKKVIPKLLKEVVNVNNTTQNESIKEEKEVKVEFFGVKGKEIQKIIFLKKYYLFLS